MRTILKGLAPAVLAVAAGCVTATPRVPSDARADAASGYVGGVFARDTVVRFGFGLRSEQTQKDYVIEIQGKGVGLIALPPGRYHVAFWNTWAVTGEQLTKKVFAASVPIARPFDLGPGEVVLLGSWAAERDYNVTSNTFKVVPKPITGPEATAAFRAAYPGFAEAPVRCVHCPPQGTPGR